MEGIQVYSDKRVVVSRDVLGRVVIAGAVDYFNADPVAAVLAGEMKRWVRDGQPAASSWASSRCASAALAPLSS